MPSLSRLPVPPSEAAVTEQWRLTCNMRGAQPEPGPGWQVVPFAFPASALGLGGGAVLQKAPRWGQRLRASLAELFVLRS